MRAQIDKTSANTGPESEYVTSRPRAVRSKVTPKRARFHEPATSSAAQDGMARDFVDDLWPWQTTEGGGLTLRVTAKAMRATRSRPLRKQRPFCAAVAPGHARRRKRTTPHNRRIPQQKVNPIPGAQMTRKTAPVSICIGAKALTRGFLAIKKPEPTDSRAVKRSARCVRHVHTKLRC